MPDFKVIDMSEHNIILDWPLFLQNNTATVIRASWKTYEDVRFRDSYRNLVNRGHRMGVYLFYQPDTPPDEQVNKFVSILKSLAFLPKFIALDCETVNYTDSSGQKINIVPPDPVTYSTWIITALLRIEAEVGIRPVIYTAQWFWDGSTVVKGRVLTINGAAYTVDWGYWKLWLASWAVPPRYPADWTTHILWQNYVAPSFPGVYGALDQNTFTGSDAELDAWFPKPTVKDVDIQIAWPFSTHPPISQMFGSNRQSYLPYGYPGHEGTDFAVMTGTPVLACFEGVVTEANSTGPYGIHVRLRHSQNNHIFHTLYGHFSALSVSLNEVVHIGQQIGLSGNSGNSTGPHMHLGLTIDGVNTDYPNEELDPMLYVVDTVTNPPVPPPTTTDFTSLTVTTYGLRLRTAPTTTGNNILCDLNPASPKITLPQPNEEVTEGTVVFEKVIAWVAKSQGTTQFVKLNK